VGKRLTWQRFIFFDQNFGPKYEKERDKKVASVSASVVGSTSMVEKDADII
jgi:hypothetical protein